MPDTESTNDALTASQVEIDPAVELPWRFGKDLLRNIWINGSTLNDDPLNIMDGSINQTGENKGIGYPFHETERCLENDFFWLTCFYVMRKKMNSVGPTFVRSGRGNYYLQWLFKNTAIVSYVVDPRHELNLFVIPYADDHGIVRYMFMISDPEIFKPNRGMEITYNMSAFLIGEPNVIEEFVQFSKNMEPVENHPSSLE